MLTKCSNEQTISVSQSHRLLRASWKPNVCRESSFEKSCSFLIQFTDMTGRTFDAVTTGVGPYRRRFSRSCKRISGVLLYLAPLHRGRANVSYQRGQNRSHTGWTRLHTRCGLEFLSQVSSNYSSLLKHFSANQN